MRAISSADEGLVVLTGSKSDNLLSDMGMPDIWLDYSNGIFLSVKAEKLV